MIFGIGTDLVKVSRIASTLNRFGSQFVNRILSPREREEFDTYTRDKSQFLASRWAIKEATYKALGATGVPFRSIQVLYQRPGIRSPLVVEFEGKAKEVADKANIDSCHVSVSHEDDYCVAFVVLEKK
ncbi:holo--carrier protein synthase [Blastocystis sp. ATCC 50177/Nand II]|uniref:Holo--carrier protein synthase n=1 Tax=Blastocystis sp. subtype 1 (strain ATCC 50177 / NandII) TaxID=478820 RepID=A0A196SHX4_BLAHN|nr:holo--carrier protein synthase [Blastocystis sp. ATCC 50177/Nand II]